MGGLFEYNSLNQENTDPRRGTRATTRYAASQLAQGGELFGNPASYIKSRICSILHARRVPDVVSPACQCGWRRQDPKHVIIFYPNHARNRHSLYEAAGTSQYRELMSTGKGLRVVARWVVSEGLLSQFSLAKEQVDYVEGRAREHDDDSADDPGQG